MLKFFILLSFTIAFYNCKSQTFKAYWSWSDSDPITLPGGFASYDFSRSNTDSNTFIHDSDIIIKPHNKAQYLIVKYPITEPNKTEWFSTSFNSGQIPDQVFLSIKESGDFKYIISRETVVLQQGFGITFSGSATLPAKLNLFEISLKNNTGVLNWKTANEVNVKGYSLEKSENGKDFKEIFWCDSKHGTYENIYTYEDNDILNNISYYRLKIVDYDAKFSISSVISITNRSKRSTKIYPNPFTNNTTICYEKSLKGGTILIRNTEGKVFSSSIITVGADKCVLSLNKLTTGIYYIILTNNGVTHSYLIEKK